MTWLLSRLARFLQRSDPSELDGFIVLDKHGHARFDLDAYLDSKEGRERVADMAAKVEAEVTDQRVEKTT
jgi:hypothetical protein